MLNHEKILSALFENIYHIFCSKKYAFELWNALEQKYGPKKHDFKRSFVEKWLGFHMVDDNSVYD